MVGLGSQLAVQTKIFQFQKNLNDSDISEFFAGYFDVVVAEPSPG